MPETLTIEVVEERHIMWEHAKNAERNFGKRPESWRDCRTPYCVIARHRLLNERICSQCLQVIHA